MLLYEDHKGEVYSIAFSPDGSAVVSAGKDGALFLRDYSGQRISIMERAPNNLAIHSLAYAPDGSLLVGGGFGWLGYRQDSKGNWDGFYPLKQTPTNALAMLNDRMLAVGTGKHGLLTDGYFELWDLTTRQQLEPKFYEPNGVWAVAVCPERRMVAWATGHRIVKVWELLKQKPIEFSQKRPCRAVAINPEGTHVAAAVDYGIKVINIPKKVDRFEVQHGGGMVQAVSYSPDGSTIASGSRQGTVKLWDAATGKERATFKWPIGRVYCLAFAPDGLRLAAGGDNGSIVVWDLD